MTRHVYVIAEAGVNHNGSVGIAAELVRAAKQAGADAVKFQAFHADALASATAPKAAYQERETGSAESQLEMLRELEFGEAEHTAMMALGKEIGIDVLSSAFDLESLAMLRRLGMTTFKIPSGEITNLPYLRAIALAAQAADGGHVILSTGMADMDEVEAALVALEEASLPRPAVTLLHCSTEYPAPVRDVNLWAMVAMRERFGVAVGYSDHTEGISIAAAAVALGASVVEKHLTLDRTMVGPDHRASLEPAAFAEMVSAIREVETALGDGVKRPSPVELENRPVVRKSIVAARAIAAGETFTADNLATKRPGTGISPMHWDEVIGAIAPRAFSLDEEVEL